ncbi:hypothetical protein PRIC2_013063 [Phytophthora ramorum]
MPGGSSSECSTELEASSSAVSASAPDTEEQYEDDGFDEYSDSFESDNDAGCDGGPSGERRTSGSMAPFCMLRRGTSGVTTCTMTTVRSSGRVHRAFARFQHPSLEQPMQPKSLLQRLRLNMTTVTAGGSRSTLSIAFFCNEP